MSEKTELVELCGLWLNESKAGNKYMAGTMGTGDGGGGRTGSCNDHDIPF